VIAIVNYGAGNTRSLRFALERLGVESSVTDRPEELERADKVILPGVGAARSAIEALERSGVAPWLRATAHPVLGICLGMQILYNTSDEWDTTCLGMMKGSVHRFTTPDLKVPHMGWNQVYPLADDPLLRGIESGAWFYFVHSFYAPMGPEAIASTNYGHDFCSAVVRDNFRGVQFHPEKSGAAGMTILSNFIQYC
jgi:glutamine amidotransferase